jgi:hypothetical protein
MDRKLGASVPIAMYRLVERVARGVHRLYLVSRPVDGYFSFLSLFVGGRFVLLIMLNGTAGLLCAIGGKTGSNDVQRTMEIGRR